MTILRSLLLIPVMSVVLMAGDPGWRNLPPLPGVRSAHAAVMTHNGDVIITGGIDASGNSLASGFVLRGATGAIEPLLNNMTVSRARFSLVEARAADGTSIIYAIGGYTGGTGAYASSDVVDVLTFDVGQNNWRWRQLGRLPGAAGDVRAVYDGAGNGGTSPGAGFVVVSGGRIQSNGAMGSGTTSAITARINIATGVIERLGNHITARSEHGVWRYIDQQGALKVLAASGEATLPTSTELLAGTAWDGRANAPRVMRHFLVDASDPTGIPRSFGGIDETNGVLSTCEWYDVKSGWRVAPRMQDARSRFNATFVASPSDTAFAWLAAAGRGGAGALASCELFVLPSGSDPAGSWQPFDALNAAASERTVSMTSSNLPVVTGGESTNTIEVYQPLRTVDFQFPDTEVGARSDSVRLVITNTWLLPITIKSLKTDGAPDFLVAADTAVIILQPSESRSILAWFRPSQPGLRTTKVTVDMGVVKDEFTLSGNGLASSLQIVTDIIDLGNVRVGRDSVVCVPLLLNTGTDTATVDSISVLPAEFELVSPVGRVRIPPNETLQVCVRFKPTKRGQLGGSANLAVGARVFPSSVRGTGVTQLLELRTSAGCDTVSATVGSEVTVTVTLVNASDRQVNVSDVTFPGTTPGRIRVANPAVFPFDVAPGASQTLDLIISVLREGTELFVVNVASTSDTLARGSVCIVVRSRSIQSSIGTIDVGQRCVGDQLERSFTLTNVSSVEVLVIDSVTVDGVPGGVAIPRGPFTLQPRTSQTIVFRWTATVAGAVNGRVLVSTSNGGTAVPIVGSVLPGLIVDVANATTPYGTVLSLPLSLSGITSTTGSIRLRFATSLLRARSASGPAVISAVVTETADGAIVDFTLGAISADSTTNMQLDLDVLRGKDIITTVTPARVSDKAACVSGNPGEVTVTGPCGGAGSLLSNANRASVNANPNPLPTDGTLSVINPTTEAVELLFYSLDGQELHRQTLGAESAEMISLSSLPSATRLVMIRNIQGLHDALLLTITR